MLLLVGLWLMMLGFRRHPWLRRYPIWTRSAMLGLSLLVFGAQLVAAGQWKLLLLVGMGLSVAVFIAWDAPSS